MAGKGLIGEFKEFIAKGNVLDMAVGVVIGGAFSSIVTSLVDDVIGPIIGMLTGGIDFSALSITVGSANLMVGNFIQAVINFFIVAVCVFSVVKAANAARERISPTAPAAVTTKICPYCKSEIALEATRCPHCTSELE